MHEGHRERMRNKLENGEKLFNHEILEMLLFNACPRANTNPIAHALLDRFVTLFEIFNASAEELTSVNGVGESVASYLKTIGKCIECINLEQGALFISSYGDCKTIAERRLCNKTSEFIEVYFTRKNGAVVRILNFTSNSMNQVSVAADKIIEVISHCRPDGLVIAHNHLNGSSKPSLNDDIFTKQVQLICATNNVNLLDHVIYAKGEKTYSYFSEGRLDSIKNEISLKRVLSKFSDGQI